MLSNDGLTDMKHTSYRRLYSPDFGEDCQWVRKSICEQLVAEGKAIENRNVYGSAYFLQRPRLLKLRPDHYVPYSRRGKSGLRAGRISWRYDSYCDLSGNHRGLSAKKTDAHRRTRRFISQHLCTIQCLDDALDMRWNERQQYGLTSWDL